MAVRYTMSLYSNRRMILFVLYAHIIQIIIRIIHAVFPRRKVQKRKPRRIPELRVAGCHVTSVRAMTARYVVDIPDSIQRKAYKHEQKLISDLGIFVKANQWKNLFFEIDTALNTRVYKPGKYPSLLGISSQRDNTRVVRKAYIESRRLLLGCDVGWM